ncbi:MAG: hypothetical protein ACPGUD_05315 [Parashewanella sp.]
MVATKRRLLNSDDLKTLYRVTDPKWTEKPRLFIVIRPQGGDWSVENTHLLRGYRACQSNLESRVRQYELKNIWPNQCDLGIGVFENESLINVLIAADLGYKAVKDHTPSLPLDDILGAIGLTRKDVQN